MNAIYQFSELKAGRRATVFISCPGDLLDAKTAVAEAVEEVGRLFAPHGLQVTSWRHETDGRPASAQDGQAVVNEQAPADYDIYLGLMCRRLGTATPRAPSGTIEEFLHARKRFIECGKPDILFYFCSYALEPEVAAERVQFEKVLDFRKAYPGLFAKFEAIEELKGLVKHHLIDLLLRSPHQRCSRRRGWALLMAQRLDSLQKPLAYLDRSSGFVVRSLGRLETLLDLPGLLSDREYEALLAAQYFRALRQRGDSLLTVHSMISDSFPTAFDWNAAVVAADLADGDAQLTERTYQLDGVRCGFLANLLRLGDALDLDHAAIRAEHGKLEPPPEKGPVENWLAYLTRSVRVSRGGAVAFHLGVPTKQQALAPSLRRSVALLFEARWHQFRPVLSAHGVAVARVPTESAPLHELVAIPDTVLAELAIATKRAKKTILDLQHFGTEHSCPVTLENLLPLSNSAIVHPVRFTFHPNVRHKLHIWSGDKAKVREVEANRPGEILLDPALLSPPGARYRWSLQRDNGDFFSEAGSGVVWQLAAADQMRLAAAKPFSGPQHTLLLKLGLHNDLLEELWPRLVSGKASLGECGCAYDALLATYEWLQINAPESGQVELIRNLGNLVYKQILNEKGK